MKINDIEFDDPREFPVYKRDMKERKEGKRTTIKELWVTGYIRENDCACAASYLLTVSNYGAYTFDSKPVKNEDEKKLIDSIFENVKFV